MSEQTTNPLLVKLEVLKKALKEERKRKNELEEEVIKLKEDVVIKQENLDKIKKELLKLREKNEKNQLSFIANIIDNNNEADEPQKENEDEEEKELLRKQIEDLNEKIVEKKATDETSNISNVPNTGDPILFSIIGIVIAVVGGIILLLLRKNKTIKNK